jgi:hypothetical protein
MTSQGAIEYTDEELERMLAEADPMPMSDEELERIVQKATKRAPRFTPMQRRETWRVGSGVALLAASLLLGLSTFLLDFGGMVPRGDSIASPRLLCGAGTIVCLVVGVILVLPVVRRLRLGLVASLIIAAMTLVAAVSMLIGGDLSRRVLPMHAEPCAPRLTRPTFALLVGVSTFTDRGLPRLPFAAQGARDFGTLLRASLPGSQTGPSQEDAIRVLTDGDATLGRLQTEIRDLFARANAVDDAQVIIYLGSHAGYERGARDVPYFLPHDAVKGSYVRTALGFRDLLSMIQEHTTAHRVLLVADVCFAGELRSRIDEYAVSSDFMDAAHNLAVIMAAAAEEAAFDASELGTSALVFAFDEAARGAGDSDRSNTITFDELSGFLRGRVPSLTAQRQTPESSRSNLAWFEPIFVLGDAAEDTAMIATAAPSPPATAALEVFCPFSGTRLYFDEDHENELAVVTDTETVITNLPAGYHILRAVLPTRRTYETTVRMQAGVTTRVSFPADLDSRPEAFGIVSDTLPGHEVLYRPVVLRGDHPVTVREDHREGCYEGETCVAIEFDLKSTDWTGVYWLAGGAWGSARGADTASLLAPRAGERVVLEWYARGRTGDEQVEFKVGGVQQGIYPDSITFARSTGYIRLSRIWARFTIDVTDADLSQVLGGFCVVTNRLHNGGAERVGLYLDEVRFVRLEH